MRFASFLLVFSSSALLGQEPLRSQVLTTAKRGVALDLAHLKRVDVELPAKASTPTPVRIGRRTMGWVTRLPDIEAAGGDEKFLLLPVPSPVVMDGRLYAGGGFHARELSALDARTGRELWRTHLEDNGPSRPYVSRRSVVINTESCTTFRLDPVTGSIRWRRHLGPSIQGHPTVLGDRIYTASRLEQGGYALFALGHETGDVLWQAPLERDVVDEPVAHGERIFVTTGQDQVLCFDQAGRTLWKSEVQASSAPTLEGQAVYVAAVREDTLELRRLDASTGEILWEVRHELEPPGDAQSRGLATATRAGRFPRIHPWGWGDERPRPVVAKGHVLIAFGQDLLVFDSARGQCVARYLLPEEYAFYAPPAWHEDELVFATLDGLIVQIDPWTGRVERALDLGVRVTSHPVVEDGRVHVTSWDLVYGIAWK